MKAKLCPKTLRAVARRMRRTARLREDMFPNHDSESLAARLSGSRDWADMLSREAHAIESKAKGSKR